MTTPFSISTSIATASVLACLWVSQAAAKPAKKPGNTTKANAITGTVSFKGTTPAPKALDMSSDAVCAKGNGVEEDVVVTGGKLANVHVRIKNGTAGKHKAPTAPVAIEQSGCVYRPRVAGAMAGQKVAIANRDKTMHNVHAYVDGESWFNRSQPKGAPDILEDDIGEPGDVFELKCNVHPWMHSYIPITDHPFFAVTGTEGTFAIPKVPAGSYTLEAWHPKFGLKSTSITVDASGSATANFQFP